MGHRCLMGRGLSIFKAAELCSFTDLLLAETRRSLDVAGMEGEPMWGQTEVDIWHVGGWVARKTKRQPDAASL